LNFIRICTKIPHNEQIWVVAEIQTTKGIQLKIFQLANDGVSSPTRRRSSSASMLKSDVDD